MASRGGRGGRGDATGAVTAAGGGGQGGRDWQGRAGGPGRRDGRRAGGGRAGTGDATRQGPADGGTGWAGGQAGQSPSGAAYGRGRGLPWAAPGYMPDGGGRRRRSRAAYGYRRPPDGHRPILAQPGCGPQGATVSPWAAGRVLRAAARDAPPHGAQAARRRHAGDEARRRVQMTSACPRPSRADCPALAGDPALAAEPLGEHQVGHGGETRGAGLAMAGVLVREVAGLTL